ncbi:ATP synthase F1 subunit delta [Algivirga pacifica]|uniref:ATP synthase subunit delta n=1 Tax=Algivirga pacifica TaxID=1162670 RepID=A0ABP9DPF2_9BACT
MSAQSRVAVRYADALMSIAKEQNTLDAIRDNMEDIHDTISGSRELKTLLKSPIVPSEKKQNILDALFAEKVNPVVKNLLALLCDKDRTEVLDAIAVSYIEKYRNLNGIQKAIVVTAIELDEEMRADFVNKVKEISGKDKVELTSLVDSSIIGGYILTVDDREIDASISSKFRALRRELVA